MDVYGVISPGAVRARISRTQLAEEAKADAETVEALKQRSIDDMARVMNLSRRDASRLVRVRPEAERLLESGLSVTDVFNALCARVGLAATSVSGGERDDAVAGASAGGAEAGNGRATKRSFARSGARDSEDEDDDDDDDNMEGSRSAAGGTGAKGARGAGASSGAGSGSGKGRRGRATRTAVPEKRSLAAADPSVKAPGAPGVRRSKRVRK